MSRMVYFIGAGLTKALALQSHPVPTMFDFIAVSAEYINDPVILTTLAELENSQPYPYLWVSDIARSLAPQLVGHQRTPSVSKMPSGCACISSVPMSAPPLPVRTSAQRVPALRASSISF